MSISISSTNGQAHTPRIPKLTYRNPLPKDENGDSAQNARPMSPSYQARASSVITSSTGSTARSDPSIAMPITPKKKSFLNGLFAKEPTMIALAQVEAELKAKHGAATAQKVPHVSSQKMPDHVPKVNSRWDGVPEVVKARDKDLTKARRQSCHEEVQDAVYAGQPGWNTNDNKWQTSRRLSDADSYLVAWQQQNHEFNGSSPASPTYTASINSSNGKHIKSASKARTATVRTSSDDSIQIKQSNSKPQEKGSSTNAVSSNAIDRENHDSARTSRLKNLSLAGKPRRDENPNLSPTPIERSPITPSFVPDEPIAQVLTTFDNTASTKSRPAPIQVNADAAFLAGEARPLQLPDSPKSSDLPLRRYADNGEGVASKLQVPNPSKQMLSPNRSRFPRTKALFKEKK